ncbi:ras-related protein Rab-3 isoform X2 [Pomacea canaliculata]|uniref:ras-related protein Rab-3 isoform X2 n=1 Tax=Pomacea canaliculata TaxID=400727 RepID=UPI000D72CFAC|nr:ras-related protein Rab-3 isoform X2 [Pomacea canaliculata]
MDWKKMKLQVPKIKARKFPWLNHHAKMASASDSKWQKDAADQNFDYMFKLLIIGNSSVGKTSFLFRYADDSFTSAFVSTVGIDFKVKTVFRQDKRVKLQIWDTAGQERYRTITTAYYRGAMGFILMYDVTNEESFNAVQDWCTQIKTHAWSNASVLLVGNKCDLEESRVVSQTRGQELAESLGMLQGPATRSLAVIANVLFPSGCGSIPLLLSKFLNHSGQGLSHFLNHHQLVFVSS